MFPESDRLADWAHGAVELPMPPHAQRGGWHLLAGRLIRRGGNYDARLFFDLGDGYSQAQYFQIGSSLKGAVNELLMLPRGIVGLLFSPGQAVEFDLQGLVLTPVGALDRRWRMLLRVVPVMWSQPAPRRKRLGLTLPKLLVDLVGCYRLASRLRAHAAAPAYSQWVKQFDTLGAADRASIATQTARWRNSPTFQVLVRNVQSGEAAVQKTLESLAGQLYRGFVTTCLARADDLGPFNTGLSQGAAGQWVLMLRAGDVLAPHALFSFASVAIRRPQATLIYADEDELDAAGQRCRPQFKPDWSWAHAHSTHFVGEAAVFRADALAQRGGVTREDCEHGCYHMVLRVMGAACSPDEGVAEHIPAVLLHRSHADEATGHALALNGSDAWAMDAVRSHLAGRGAPAQVEPTAPGCWQVRYPLPAAPAMVSVIVPTRDALALTRQCLQGLLSSTNYPNFEILLVDNQSSDPEALAYMRALAAAGAVRLIRYKLPFNYSAINNLAVQEARGEAVCLLNNDTQVLHAEWLSEMVSHLMQPRVAVVGAKLIYPNGRLQHGGDLVGVGGVANHAHMWIEGDDPGYCSRAAVAQEYSAVTAACLLTWRHRYLALGGLNDKRLPVSFNDVDYCLRVREAGESVVWTPHARLIHHESVSRGKDLSPADQRRAAREAAYMRKRWGHVMGCDPFYNPNLSHARADFSLSHAPVAPDPRHPLLGGVRKR